MDVLLLAVFVGGVGCILLLSKHWFTFSKLPPGPRGWPMVGNAFQQHPIRPQITWSKWEEKYGEIFTLNHFGSPLVVCNSFEAIWEMLVSKSNDFAGRPEMYPLKYVTGNGKDVSMGDFNPEWVFTKKNFTKAIKMYGDGMDHLENIMADIITDLVEDFQKTEQKPFDPLEPIDLAICNALALMLLGEKFDYKDANFQHLRGYTVDCSILFSATLELFLLDAFPWLHYLPLSYCRRLDRYVNGLQKELLPRMIQNRMTKYDADHPSCILDGFLKQYEEDKKMDAQYPCDMEKIIQYCHDFFIAGLMTSTATIYTMMAILTARQDVQDKLRSEVDEVLGGRRPKLQDKQTMPYYLAVLEEVLRYAVIVIGDAHKATVDSSICGHFIPKDTPICANVWHLCHDINFWRDPWVFRPERFLDQSGSFVTADNPARKHVLVFGAGRRLCPGELLARNRIFLIFTSLLQNFVFKPAADDQVPQCDPYTYCEGAVFKPQPYKIKAIPRE